MKSKTLKISLSVIILSAAACGIWFLVHKLPKTGDAAFNVGTRENPLKVGIVSYTGYGPALVANGGSLKTQPGSVFDQLGISVEFVIEDSIPTVAESLGPRENHCVSRTIDMWAQQHPGLLEIGKDARMIGFVDCSEGADAVVALNQTYKIEDLANKKIGLAKYSISHFMLHVMVEKSKMSSRQKQNLLSSGEFTVFADDPSQILPLLERGDIDAAVLWDPYVSLVKLKNSSAHNVCSSRDLPGYILDGIICSNDVIRNNPESLKKLLAGWMKGIEMVQADRKIAAQALVSQMSYYKVLEEKRGFDFITDLYDNVRLTNLENNKRLFSLGGGSDGESEFVDPLAVYTMASGIWRKNGGIKDTTRPAIDPKDAFDSSFVKALSGK